MRGFMTAILTGLATGAGFTVAEILLKKDVEFKGAKNDQSGRRII